MIVLGVIQPREYTNSVTSYDALSESCGLGVFSLNDAKGEQTRDDVPAGERVR
jgi:hypothetical protein